MPSPAKENRAGGSAAKKRAAGVNAEPSPAKKQQRKKPSKKDRRRVSFAPDTELTMVHHFLKDDDYTSNSDGRVEVPYEAGAEPPQQAAAGQQHPALAGGAGAYRPGFWNKTVPENSPLSMGNPLPAMLCADSPGSVSMELTQPTLMLPAQQQHQQHQPGEVTAGLPSLGALAEADELEGAEEEAPPAAVPGEVTATLPSLGALADEWEQEEGQRQGLAGDGWAVGAPADANVTANITAALPGLDALVAEDEDATAGMDLTVPAGRVLEHYLQQQQQQQASPAPTLAAAPSPAAAPVAIPSPGQQQLEGQHPALAAPEAAPPAGELEPTVAVGGATGHLSMGRLSVGPEELAAAKAGQMNKWGFAPGQEDTLDINLELHGRMIMGDQTFNRLYCDNTTGDSRLGAPDAPGAADDTSDSLLLHDMEEAAAGATAPSPAAAAPSPAAPSPAPAAPAVPAGPFGAPVLPAFLPPYMQAPAASGALSDHPALVHSPDVTNSSFGTLEMRRVSVDTRRMSINSRRFSMQDATGRLLADDDASLGATDGLHHQLAPVAETPGSASAGVPPGSGGPASGTRSRRRSSSAQFLGRDVTDKLLVDDSLPEDDVGPLADLKRQMRMLSQGSPVLVPAAEQAAAAAEAAQEQQLAADVAAAASAGEAPLGKTPRTAVSMGYADSHNPATLRLLCSGGTTRLLAEADSLAGDEADTRGQGGQAGGPAGGDNAATARTTGTTKLLADMTMASSIGAKLLSQQGTPELPHASGADNGLTGFSLDLDEFELPPELPPGAQQQQQQQAEDAAMAEAEEQALLAEEEAYQQAVAAQHQQYQGGDGYASPAMLPGGGEFGTGYPLDEVPGSGEPIPGGPKLHRTPVSTRPTSQPRTMQGTPHSNVRSLRSQQQAQHYQGTPSTHGTRGTHRLARTPGSMRQGAAAYPINADVTGDHEIPGGPKLARTPMGRTPATGGRLAAPGSAVAQHYPGSGARGVHFAALPGSALRAPGSAAALHRSGGMTPQYAPAPMTFQDFCKLSEVQFLDNLRRGASINYADLQPNPVPTSLGEAYRLLTLTAPQLTTLENGVRILQEEIGSRKITAADAEAMVGQINPPAFQRAAAADDEELEQLRGHVGLLKKVCRQKAVYCLKDVRRQMEESRGARLRRNLDALQGDLDAAQRAQGQMEVVAKAAQQYVVDEHARMEQETAARREEVEWRAAVISMRQRIPEETAANEQRRAKLAEVQERVAKLREEHGVLHREREALRSRTDALQMTLMQSSGQEGLGRESSPAAIIQKLEELDVLNACVGWQLESAEEDPVAGEAVLRLADLFRLRLSVSRVDAVLAVETLPEADCKVPASSRALLAALAGCPAEGAAAEVRVTEASGAKVATLVQATTSRLSRVADLAAELDGLRLAFPALTDATCSPDGALVLSFVNLDAEVKFGVSLRLPASYPMGPVQAEPRVWFDGEGQVTQQRIAAAVAAAPEAPGRVRAICRELSQLAREALPQLAAQGGGGAPFGWQNPLFSALPAVPAQ